MLAPYKRGLRPKDLTQAIEEIERLGTHLQRPLQQAEEESTTGGVANSFSAGSRLSKSTTGRSNLPDGSSAGSMFAYLGPLFAGGNTDLTHELIAPDDAVLFSWDGSRWREFGRAQHSITEIGRTGATLVIFSSSTHIPPIFIDSVNSQVGVGTTTPLAGTGFHYLLQGKFRIDTGGGTGILVDPVTDQVILGDAVAATLSKSVIAGAGFGVEESFAVNRIDVTSSPYNVTTNDFYLSCDASGGAITLNLPATNNAGVLAGHMLLVYNRGGANNVTIAPNGANVSDVTVLTPGQGVLLISNGGNGALGRWEAPLNR